MRQPNSGWQGGQRKTWAFTLIELLVTLVVIVILAGITVAALPGIMDQVCRSRVLAEMMGIGTALDSYKTDTGAYPYAASSIAFPDSASATDPSDYIAASRFLYQELVASNDVEGTPVIHGYFKPKESMLNGKPLQVDTYLVDPWGYAYGYAPADPAEPESTPSHNTGYFDLWSTGGSTTDKTESWIVNWPDDTRRSVY